MTKLFNAEDAEDAGDAEEGKITHGLSTPAGLPSE
jgi:hypothetical protein